MLVKYKLLYLINFPSHQLTLKTMLVKYKFPKLKHALLKLSFKNNAC